MELLGKIILTFTEPKGLVVIKDGYDVLETANSIKFWRAFQVRFAAQI